MIITVLRSLGAIIAGIAVAGVLVVAVEAFSSVVHPFPDDFDGSFEEVCLLVEKYPHWVLAVVVAAWGATGFAGTWTAGWLGNRATSLILGLLLLSLAIFNISMLPYPTWFAIAAPLAIAIGSGCGYRLSSHRTSAAVKGKSSHS